MKKLPLLLMLIFSLWHNTGMSQPGNDTFWETDENTKTVRMLDDDCVILRMDLGKQLIVRDCPNYDYNEFNPGGTFGLQVEPICLSGECHMQVELFFEGQLIFEQSTGANKHEIQIAIDYHYLDNLLGSDFEGTEAELKLAMTKKCFESDGNKFTQLVSYDPIIQIFPIQVRHAGEKYIAEIKTNDRNIAICEELYGYDKDKIRKIDLCCSGKLHLGFNFNKISGTNISLSGTISKSQHLGFLDSDFSISYNVTDYEISELFQSFGISYDLEPDGDGCVYPGLSVRLLSVQKCLFEVNCEGPDIIDVILEEYDEIVEISPFACKYYHECPEQDPKPRMEHDPESRFSFEDCLTNVSLHFGNPLPDMNYEVEWIGPGGDIYYGTALNQVPFGKYELTVFDECCHEYHYTYNICDEQIFGTWYYEEGRYCRVVTCLCNDDPALRNNETYTMCVDPHRFGDWYFNENTKKCNRHAFWTDQNAVEWDLSFEVGETDIAHGDINVVKDPWTQEYYDESSGKCIRDYYCHENGSTGYYDEYDPTYGEWAYDDFWEECYREILCFDQAALDESGNILENESIDAEFGDWEYDDFWETCYRKIYCSGNQVFDDWGDEMQDEADEVEIDWTVENDWDFECIGRIYCDEDLTEEEITVEADASWDLNSSGDCISTSLYCADESMDNISESPDDVSDWLFEDWAELCYKNIHCETADETFQLYANTQIFFDPENNANCSDPDCAQKVFCDGEETEIYFCDCTGSPPGNQTANSDRNHSKEQWLARSENAESLLPNEFKYFRLYFYSMDGKRQKIQVFKKTHDIEQSIKDFKKNKALPNLMYIYSVFGENTFLYSKKFIITK